MKWEFLTNFTQVKTLIEVSESKPVLIYKHSTRCSASRMILDRLERDWSDHEMSSVTPFFLDLISYREISDAIVHTFDVEHESPQILVIHRGKSIYDKSHYGISYKEISGLLKNFCEKQHP